MRNYSRQVRNYSPSSKPYTLGSSTMFVENNAWKTYRCLGFAIFVTVYATYFKQILVSEILDYDSCLTGLFKRVEFGFCI